MSPFNLDISSLALIASFNNSFFSKSKFQGKIAKSLKGIFGLNIFYK
jgi:hypothetical protein